MNYEPWAGAEFAPRRWQAEALPIVQRSIVSGKRNIIHAATGAGKSRHLAEIVAWAISSGGFVVCTVPSRDLVRQLAKTLEARVGARNVGRFYTSAKQPDRRVVVCCNDSIHSLMMARTLPIDLWIADEVHQTEAETLQAGASLMQPRRAIGYTATPYRSDDKESLSMWDEVIYRYSIGDALTDGVLVPWDVHHWDGEGEATDINAICTRLILAHCTGPGIVSARSIEDAECYAEELTAAGVKAEAIHSKLTNSIRVGMLAALESGGLDALVHVSLLAEGVDLPWLRWLCLRRRVQARVRFVQEVGRVLRVCPGKTKAVIIDPYDLFSQHGISHPSALGEPPAKKTPDEIEEDPFPLLELPPLDRPVPPAVAVDAVGAWSRAMLRLMETAGLHVPDKRWGKVDARWRRSKSSPKQSAALGRMAVWSKYMPKEHREAVKAVCGSPGMLRAGVASDLMDVLSAIAKASEPDRRRKRHWRWPTVLDVPVLPKRVIVALGGA